MADQECRACAAEAARKRGRRPKHTCSRDGSAESAVQLARATLPAEGVVPAAMATRHGASKRTQSCKSSGLAVNDDVLALFECRSKRVVHSLDLLRPSKQYDRSGEVSGGLHDFISDSERYEPHGRLKVLCQIGLPVLDIIGRSEIGKCVTSCGGIQYDLREAMEAALRAILAQVFLNNLYVISHSATSELCIQSIRRGLWALGRVDQGL